MQIHPKEYTIPCHRFQAVDDVGAVSSILTVTIYLCACSGNGACLEGQWNQVTQDFYLAECLCNTGYSGKSNSNLNILVLRLYVTGELGQ